MRPTTIDFNSKKFDAAKLALNRRIVDIQAHSGLNLKPTCDRFADLFKHYLANQKASEDPEIKMTKAAHEFLLVATYAHFYLELQQRGELDLQRVKSLLDLGCGYRICAGIYQELFPNCHQFLGIENNVSKISAIDQALRITGAAPDKFPVAIDDFMHPAFPLAGREPHQIILMQSFYTNENYSTKDFRKFFAKAAKALDDQGKLVLLYDLRDLRSAGMYALHEAATAKPNCIIEGQRLVHRDFPALSIVPVMLHCISKKQLEDLAKK